VREIPLDSFRKCELFTLSKVMEACVCARGEPHGTRLTAITPGCTNHRMELGPLRGIKILVTPLLELYGGRLLAQ